VFVCSVAHASDWYGNAPTPGACEANLDPRPNGAQNGNRKPDIPVKAEREVLVLALNSGSSSLKFGLYRMQAQETHRLISGEAESIGKKKGDFHAQDAHGAAVIRESAALPTQEAAVTRFARLLIDLKMPARQSVGHRIVHGGPKLRHPCVIDDSVLGELEAATAFAPLHMPAALSVIRCARTLSRAASGCVFRHHLSCKHAGTWHACCRSPGRCGRKGSNAMGFMAFPANRLCVN
jgi:hypothetical protein